MAKTINILIYGLDNDEAVKMLLEEQMTLNGITNFKMFTDPETFLKNLDAKPHIGLLDYFLDPSPLTGLDITRIAIDQNPEFKAIMMSEFSEARTIVEFFRAGGFDWVFKGIDIRKFNKELVESVQKAIGFIKSKLEFQEEIDQMREESKLRKLRKAISNETTDY